MQRFSHDENGQQRALNVRTITNEPCNRPTRWIAQGSQGRKIELYIAI
jgi:hypothetical protein